MCVLAFISAPGFAQQPPGSDCRRVSKVEYDSAKSYYLLQTKLGAYVRTRHGAIIDVAARSVRAAATLAINERQRKSPA